MGWVSVSMHDTIVRIIKNGERAPEDERNPKAKQAAIKEVGDLLSILDAHLAGKQYVLGESFSLVDCACAAMVPFLSKLGVDTNPHQNVNGWVGRCMAR